MTRQFHKRPIAAEIQALQLPKTAPEPEAADTDEAGGGWIAEMLGTEVEREITLPVFGENIRAEQSALVKTIGTRMKEARELCNMTQVIAARRLGYERSAKLSKIEGASDTNSVPLYVVARAAKLYDVSIDYLFGITDDFDSEANRPLSGWLADALDLARQRDLQVMARLHAEVQTTSLHLPALTERAKEVHAAVETFRANNRYFDEMKSSARVVCSIERLLSATKTAMAALRRLNGSIAKPNPTNHAAISDA